MREVIWCFIIHFIYGSFNDPLSRLHGVESQDDLMTDNVGRIQGSVLEFA